MLLYEFSNKWEKKIRKISKKHRRSHTVLNIYRWNWKLEKCLIKHYLNKYHRAEQVMMQHFVLGLIDAVRLDQWEPNWILPSNSHNELIKEPTKTGKLTNDDEETVNASWGQLDSSRRKKYELFCKIFSQFYIFYCIKLKNWRCLWAWDINGSESCVLCSIRLLQLQKSRLRQNHWIKQVAELPATFYWNIIARCWRQRQSWSHHVFAHICFCLFVYFSKISEELLNKFSHFQKVIIYN